MANQTYETLANQAAQAGLSFPSGSQWAGTTITDVSSALGPDYTIPVGFLQVGSVMRVTAAGTFTVSGSATSLTLQIMIGGTTGTSLFTTGSVALSTSGTNAFRIESLIKVTSLASTGTAVVDTIAYGISTTANAGVGVLVRSTPNLGNPGSKLFNFNPGCNGDGGVK